MKKVDKLIFKTNSKEEYLSGYSEDFPHIASYVELNKYPKGYVPWHWHNTLELFYIESGSLEYYTPQGKQIFTNGMGGLVNSNVLHMTKVQSESFHTIQLIHLFDSVFISGKKGNLIDKKYMFPFITNSAIELLVFSPDCPKQNKILNLMIDSFLLEENEIGYELRLREKLSEIWLKILQQVEEQHIVKSVCHKSNSQIKQIMIYIQEHYVEKISITQLANEVFLSERECYRIFQKYLHMTPMEYVRSYRLQMACQMLLKEEKNIAEISQACGMGSSSYFGKVFKEHIGCTPLEYKRKWQNNDI